MAMSPVLFVHICGATIGLLSGYMALLFRKGSGLHGAAGNVFFIAMLCALGDVRMIMRGGIVGARRIARHLWRMCLALLIATFSFFPGQTKIFSRALRAMPVLYLPHILLLGAMIFWLIRFSMRKRFQLDRAFA